MVGALRTSTVDHDQSPSTATARSLEYPSVTTDEAQLKIRASVPTGAASNTTREDADTTTTTTTGIHATDQLLVSTTPYHPRNGSAPCLDDALLRAPLPPSTDSLGSTGLRPIPPHYYRDPAHGPGVGSGLLPRVPPPTCSRPVSGVGLGPFVMRLLCCSLPAPARRQFFALRSATVCH